MEKIVMSRRDVIVCRGIWYVMTLLSLFGLSISLNLLWPAGGKSSSSSSWFLRDGAVSATTLYAVTLLRYLFFTDPPSTDSYKDFTTRNERIPQLVFAEVAMLAFEISPLTYLGVVGKVSSVLYMSLFTVSLFTGGIGLIQLSDKLRMEMRHAYLTLFSGWFCCLLGISMSLQENVAVVFLHIAVYEAIALWIFGYNLFRDKGFFTSSVSPLLNSLLLVQRGIKLPE